MDKSHWTNRRKQTDLALLVKMKIRILRSMLVHRSCSYANLTQTNKAKKPVA